MRCVLGKRSSAMCLRGPTRTRVTSAPTIAPMWTIGPSRPIGSPVATMKVMPMPFATSVEKRRIPGTRTPLRYALTWTPRSQHRG
eukprot:5011179-Pleurochrysis_carterae.AAC.1